MPRLFTGIEVPAEIRLALSAHRGGLPGARWVDPDQYHMTLRFIGDVDATLGAPTQVGIFTRLEPAAPASGS